MLIFRDEIESTYEKVDETVRTIINKCKNIPELDDKSLLFKLSLILRELLNNSVEHGNKFDQDKNIVCEVRFINSVIEITVIDEGEGIEIDVDLMLQESPSTEVNHRNRGFKILKKMDFELMIAGNKITAKYKIPQNE